MADSGIFDSAWLKLAWAVLKTQELDAEIQRFKADPIEQSRSATSVDYQPKCHCFVVTQVVLPIFPPRCTLLLGDIAHSYRCCLDHIAWALVSRGRQPPERLRNERERSAIGFPITYSSPEFTRARKGTARSPSRLPGIRLDDLRVVRALQPYAYGQRFIPHHSLKVLADFSNQDKHRTIEPTKWLPAQPPVIEIDNLSDCTLTRAATPNIELPLEANTELARIYVRKTGPNPNLRFKISAPVEPALSATMPLSAWLREMIQIVGMTLRGLADPPPSVDVLIPRHLELPPEFAPSKG